MSREIVQTDKAPKAIGPYAQAIKANGFVYTAGQIAIRPESGEIDRRRHPPPKRARSLRILRRC